MTWYVYFAHFFAGAFLVNSIPHFVNGVSGRRFQSPFASPPGVGESSPLVNVFWGVFNFVVGYVLLYGIGEFRCGLTKDVLSAGLGGLAMAICLAWHLDRIRNR